MQAVYFETTAAGGISWEEVQESQLKGDADGSADKKQARKKLSISIPKWCGKWVVSMDEYKDGVVGAKSKNLAGEHLRGTACTCLTTCEILGGKQVCRLCCLCLDPP